MRVLRARLHQIAQEEADAGGVGGPRSRRSARSTARSASAPTTSRRTGSPTTAPATRPTTSTPCWTATSTRSCSRPSTPTRPPAGGGRRGRLRLVTDPARGGPGRLAATSRRPASPQRRRRRRGAGRARPAAPTTGEVRRLMVLGAEAPAGLLEAYAGLVAERARRVPLQHLTGRAAFRHLELSVGPGVFVPRPETEMVADLAVAAAARPGRPGAPRPVVVDLCTGSGAIALRRRSTRCRRPRSTRSSCPTWRTRGPSATGDDLGLDVELRARRRHDRLRRAGGRGRRRRQQPAVHPGRCGARRPRGARPRPGRRALRRQRRRPGGSRWRWPPGPPGCCVPAGCC